MNGIFDFFFREIGLRRWRKVEVVWIEKKRKRDQRCLKKKKKKKKTDPRFFSLRWIYGGKGKTRIFILLSLQPISSALTSKTTVCPHVSLK